MATSISENRPPIIDKMASSFCSNNTVVLWQRNHWQLEHVIKNIEQSKVQITRARDLFSLIVTLLFLYPLPFFLFANYFKVCLTCTALRFVYHTTRGIFSLHHPLLLLSP